MQYSFQEKWIAGNVKGVAQELVAEELPTHEQRPDSMRQAPKTDSVIGRRDVAIQQGRCSDAQRTSNSASSCEDV
jgi:hypothetical protein